MCIPGDYWREKTGIARDCKAGFTKAEKQEAYKAKFGANVLEGKWTVAELINWFPGDKAEMTQEEVEAFANGLAAS